MAAFDVARNIARSVELLLDVYGSEHLCRGGEVDAELPLTFDADGGGDRNADSEVDRQDDVELLPARGVDGGDDRHVERGEHRLADGSEDALVSAQVGVGLAAFMSGTQDIDIYLVRQERARSDRARS